MQKARCIKLTFSICLFLFCALIFAPATKAQLADSPCPMFRCNLRHTGQSTVDTSTNNGTVLWTFKTGGGIESTPTLGADGTIYVGSHDNKLYAINPDGTQKWAFSAGDPVFLEGEEWEIYKGILSSPAVASDGTIYFTTLRNYLYALTPEGKEKWKFPLAISSSTWTSPTIGPDGTIYIGSARMMEEGLERGKIYAINPDGTEKWHFHTESDVCPAIAIANDGTIYSGNGASGKFYAINPDGTPEWMFQTHLHIESSAAIGTDGTIYVASWDNNLYALTPDGKEKWHFATGGEGIVASPAIANDGTILLNADDGNLYAINPDGTQKWKLQLSKPVENGSSPIIEAEGTIYVGTGYMGESDKPTFYAITQDGTIKWSISADSFNGSSPIIGRDGTIYVGSMDGKLYAIGKGNTITKISNQLKDHLKCFIPIIGIGLLLSLTIGIILWRRKRKKLFS